MTKDLTVKDVLYALEYLGDALVRMPFGLGKAKWQMRTGAAVKETIANEVRASGFVTPINERDGRQLIVWRKAA